MFGVVPRVVWQKLMPPDESGRVQCAHNCLLLESLDTPHGARPLRVLIETGSGDKFDPKMRAVFGLDHRSIADAVQQTGIPCHDINHLILSHLHFDHAGGLTRLPRPGESPDFTIERPAFPLPTGVKLAFPTATIHVQRREWNDALVNRSAMTKTYLPENLLPLRDHLALADSPPPFPPGYIPARDELPSIPLHQRTQEILPGIFVFLVPGHTWGQQAIRFTAPDGTTVLFSPDIVPTVHHAGAAYNMAYDVEPFISTVTRKWYLQAAADNDWLLILDHEPTHPFQRVRPDGKNWFKLVPEPPEKLPPTLP
jgi:glyoxylase-like metal-dependent hydrolase (beta-lactamase superfamily II)